MSQALPVPAVIPRGWHRPVRPVALLLLAGGLLLVWVALVAWAIWYVYGHWESRVHLQRQALLMRLPEGTAALAEMVAPISTRVQAQPVVRVPLKQTIEARLTEPLVAQLRVRTTVPVDTVLEVQHQVPVRTTLQAQVDLGRWLPTLDVVVPVALTVPVRLSVPVRAQVPLDLDLVVSGEMRQAVPLTLDQTLMLRPRLDAPVQAQLTRQTRFALHGETAPIPLELLDARLRVPFDLTFLRQRAGGVGSEGGSRH